MSSSVLRTRIAKQARLLQALKRVDETTRLTLISNAKKELIDALVAVARLVVASRKRLTRAQIARVRAIASDITSLLRPGSTLEQRKRVLQKGGFIGALLGLVPRLLGGLLGSAFGGGRRR